MNVEVNYLVQTAPVVYVRLLGSRAEACIPGGEGWVGGDPDLVPSSAIPTPPLSPRLHPLLPTSAPSRFTAS